MKAMLSHAVGGPETPVLSDVTSLELGKKQVRIRPACRRLCKALSFAKFLKLDGAF